ncbi:hypothetical protein [Nonomuraea sp. NPDC005501]|uniref:hypothetical protein n=1 Tax=Nonomuraea sp. NPDC005501 TaxID=3156884 RepID=UPI0033B7E645
MLFVLGQSVHPVRGGPVGPGRMALDVSLLGVTARMTPGIAAEKCRPQRRVLPGQRHRRPDPRPGHLFPDDSAYTTAALVGIGAMAITTPTSLALARPRSSETNP